MKKIVVINLIFIILSYLLLSFIPVTSSIVHATDMSAGTLSRDIAGIDDNLYPGYKQLINSMQSKHSNYSFLVYYTGLDWNEVLVTEYQGHGRSPLNLFQVGTNYNGKWMCSICGTKKYDNGSWCCASLEALAYMMDPRVSINDNDIFQFKDLEGSDVTYNDIAKAVSSYGSYINNPETIEAIVEASNIYNINGYFLVAKIINEHGKNGSTLSNGNGYNGKYVGIYNFFNIGSTGSGSANIINNGLSYAQNQGWTSRKSSILGGAAVVKNSYITRYSQNTLYYQKFNVSGKSALGSHQYQQNIMAAQSQGISLKAYYGSSNTPSSYTFIIPLYKNMPKTVTSRPNANQVNSVYYENGKIQNISTSLKVRASANGTAIGALNNEESIKILLRATNKVGGYYWDLIVSNTNGTYGYAAREVGGEICIASVGGGGTSCGTATTGSVTQPTSTPTTVPTQPGKPELPTVKHKLDLEKDISISGNYINTVPVIMYEHLKEKYKDVKVKDSFGKEVTSGELGTGYKVTIAGKTYTIVKKGDLDGDGILNVVDVIEMLDALKGTVKLENEYKLAACVSEEDGFDITDVVLLLDFINEKADINL